MATSSPTVAAERGAPLGRASLSPDAALVVVVDGVRRHGVAAKLDPGSMFAQQSYADCANSDANQVLPVPLTGYPVEAVATAAGTTLSSIQYMRVTLRRSVHGHVVVLRRDDVYVPAVDGGYATDFFPGGGTGSVANPVASVQASGGAYSFFRPVRSAPCADVNGVDLLHNSTSDPEPLEVDISTVPAPIVVSVAGAATASTSQAVTFTVSLPGDPYDGNSDFDTTWDFGDGQTQTIHAGLTATHRFTGSRRFSVTATVAGDGFLGTGTHPIIVTGAPAPTPTTRASTSPSATPTSPGPGTAPGAGGGTGRGRTTAVGAHGTGPTVVTPTSGRARSITPTTAHTDDVTGLVVGPEGAAGTAAQASTNVRVHRRRGTSDGGLGWSAGASAASGATGLLLLGAFAETGLAATLWARTRRRIRWASRGAHG